MNDPYGVHWDGSGYHLFHQAVADGTTWAPECMWGHAVSTDLVAWEERPPILVPGPFELGCWSGCVAGGQAYYTRVHGADPDVAQVAVARFDASGLFHSGPEDVVIPGPPDGLGITAFRDPFVIPDGTGLRMIVGAGAADGTGLALGYRSADPDRWHYDGVLRRGRIGSASGVRADEVWECPQLVHIGDEQVLIVSLQSDDQADHVAVSVGDGGWQRLVHGPSAYATSAFTDRDGRPCVISWLREDERHDPASRPWSGAQSLVSVLGIDADGRVTLTPHENVLGSPLFTTPATGVLDAGGPPVHMTFRGPVDVEVRYGRHSLLRARDEGRNLAVTRPGRGTDLLLGSSPETHVFLDADIVEIYTGGAYGAWRLGP